MNEPRKPKRPPDWCPRCTGANRGAPHSPKCPNRGTAVVGR